jgi:hypothetical protein
MCRANLNIHEFAASLTSCVPELNNDNPAHGHNAEI